MLDQDYFNAVTCTPIENTNDSYCTDTNYGALDEDGDGCEYYNEYPEDCGCCDDEDFIANEVCCSCKEGY